MLPYSRDVIHAVFGRADSNMVEHDRVDTMPGGTKSDGSAIELARCFLRLANLPNFALDRFNRYEATLWRQMARILFALDVLDRRKPQERRRYSCIGRRQDATDLERE
jgi:hypothetical protein